MAVNNTHRDGNGSEDGVARDAHLALLMQAAGDEAPPLALDAAILAAARRAVQAGPRPVAQTAGAGGGEPGVAAPAMPRAKRNWYLPVSIAAVVVMSASLVTIVHHEKGDELAQPTAVRAPPVAPAPTAQAPKEAVEESAARMKAEAALSDTTPAIKAKTSEMPAAKRDDLARAPAVGSIASGDSTRLRKQVEVPQAAPADARLAERAAGGAGAPSAAVTATAAKAASGTDVAKPASPAPPAPPATAAPETGFRAEAGAAAPAPAARDTRPDPFPAVESAPARQRAETDRNAMGGAVGDALPPPKPAAKPAPKPAAAPVVPAPAVSAAPSVFTAPRATSADDGLSRAAPPPEREGRVLAAPAAKPPAQVQRSMQQASRPSWLAELDNQPVEKWLERLAQLKREGRSAEADELMAEFRRRFPDHPASVR